MTSAGMPGFVVDSSLLGIRVVRELDQVFEMWGAPCMVVSGNGTEMTFRVILAWQKERGVEWHSLRPKNCPRTASSRASMAGCVTSAAPPFASLPEARGVTEAWKTDFDTLRSHTSFNKLTPTEFAARTTEGHGPRSRSP